MALTVSPPASFSDFNWLLTSNNLDRSIYCDDDDIMDFSDSSGEFVQSHNQTHQSRSIYANDNNNSSTFNMQAAANSASKFSLDLADESQCQSKEAWPADYVKTILLGGSNSRKRKNNNDWSQQQQQSTGDEDFAGGENLPEPQVKVASRGSGGDRKSQVSGRIQWPDELDLDLSAELMNSNQYSNDSLLNFSNLTVLKQEVPSSPNNDNGAAKPSRSPSNFPKMTPISPNCMRSLQMSQSTAAVAMMSDHIDQTQAQQQQTGNSSASSSFLEQMSNESRGVAINDEFRFQYVLAAATSIATKSNEETLTYLNQGQSYEIKLKKLGDLSNCRGKLMRSIVKICFHERRLQYMEREQLQIWQSSRPGEKILDIDIPLSYGLIHVNQSTAINTAEILWDPMKEVGVYIKVNCISTEFTPKKHGGEKGVPFRIQIETYVDGSTEANQKFVHGAACQIKVFKLKGADRKHKQDRERIQKRPSNEQDKYQRSYDCTILNDISSDNLVSSTIGCYSPEHVRRSNLSPVLPSSPLHIPSSLNPMMPFAANSLVSSTNGLCKVVVDQNNGVVSTESEEAGGPQIIITKDSTPQHLTQWLAFHRLNSYANTFMHFSGCDVLRMSKDDLIQVCGLADGIRMFNILHIKPIQPRLTLFVSFECNTYHAIYLHTSTTKELIQKLYKVPGFVNSNLWKFVASSPTQMSTNSSSNPNLNEDSNFKVFVHGPNNVLVVATDEVIANFKDESLFALEVYPTSGGILMRAVKKTAGSE